MLTNDALAIALHNRNQDQEFLLHDDFSLARAAGTLNGTEADRGPGFRIPLDTNGKMSVAGGKLVFATGAVGNFDPALVYRGLFSRLPGRILRSRVMLSAGRLQVGWLHKTNWLTDDSFTASGEVLNNRRGSLDFNAGVLAVAPAASGSITVGAYSTGVEYQICVIMRLFGTQYFIKGGAFTEWTLLAVDSSSTNPTAAPFIGQLGTTTVATVSELFLKNTLWLAPPLLSDGFAQLGVSDGAGHAEGVAGTLGNGGANKVWTDRVGTFNVSGGLAVAATLSSGVAISTVSTVADVVVKVNVFWVAGKAGLALRVGGSTHRIYVVHTGTHIQAWKRISGSETSLLDQATTYVAGAELCIIASATTFLIFYNNALITTLEIADSQVQSSVHHGLYTDDLSNNFDNFVAYARGTNSEYAVLDYLTSDYLLYDSFVADYAAGALSGTLADPGPGERFTVADTNNKLSTSGGKAFFATGGVGQGNPGIFYRPFSRAAGLVCIGRMTATSGGIYIGFSPQTGGQPGNSILARPGLGDLLVVANNVAGVNVGTVATATYYWLASVLRATGIVFFIKGGAFTNWVKLWSSPLGSTAAQYPAIGSSSGTITIGSVDFIVVPKERWLPTPVISDGFGSSFGTTDGLGHAEGMTGGLGSGGGGLAWAQPVGTWAVAGGVANASALSGGSALATINSGKTDLMLTANLTVAGGTAGIILRYVDANNYVEARHTGSNGQLVKVVAGVPTTLIDAAATYSANASLRVICEGQKFRLYYNNLLVDSEKTIADGALASGTLVGIRTTNTGNTFDGFVAFPRGTGGEYAELDSFL